MQLVPPAATSAWHQPLAVGPQCQQAAAVSLPLGWQMTLPAGPLVDQPQQRRATATVIHAPAARAAACMRCQCCWTSSMSVGAPRSPPPWQVPGPLPAAAGPLAAAWPAAVPPPQQTLSRFCWRLMTFRRSHQVRWQQLQRLAASKPPRLLQPPTWAPQTAAVARRVQDPGRALQRQ
jgi:hypothetical protein